MARIPLAEIPNAEYGGGGVGMIGVPDFRADLGQVAAMLRQGRVEAAPFVAAAGGGVALGQALAKANGLFAELTERMAESKNQADLSRAEEIMQEAQAGHAKEMMQKPDEEWVKLWDSKYVPQAEKALEKLKLSAWALDRVGPQFRKFATDTRVKVTYGEYKARIERDRQDILNGINRATEAGNFEGALDGIARLVAGHHATPEQGEKMSDEIEVRARESNAIEWMNDDPSGFMEALDAEELGLQPADKLRMRQQAGTLSRQRCSEAVQALDDDILKGAVKTEEQVRQRAAAAGLSERDTQSFVEALMVTEQNSPEGRARYQATYDRLWQNSLNYDPGDDADGTKALGILREIRSAVTPGERQPLLENLRNGQREGRTVARQRGAALEAYIDRLAEYGLLVRRPLNPTDAGEMARYEQERETKAAGLKRDARAWIKQNPGTDLTKDFAWLSEKVGAEVETNALQYVPVRNGGNR